MKYSICIRSKISKKFFRYKNISPNLRIAVVLNKQNYKFKNYSKKFFHNVRIWNVNNNNHADNFISLFSSPLCTQSIRWILFEQAAVFAFCYSVIYATRIN